MSKALRSTDYGTVILHALLVISLLVLVATGLRIAADDPESAWLAVLDPILPAEQLWFNHLVSGVMLGATLAGYAHYIVRARLQARVRLDKARLVAVLRPGRGRWASINVVVYWVLIVALVVEVVTGVLLFSGYGGQVLRWHLDATYICLAAVAAHVALHAAYGGLSQLVRIIRPAPLVVGPAPPDLAELLAEQLARNAHVKLPEVAGDTRPTAGPATLEANPFANAVAIALVTGGLAIGAEQWTRPTLDVVAIAPGEAPLLDGDISDPVWARTKTVAVLTTQGGDFGGTHELLVEVRAVHDGVYAYFAFVWEDPTRSLKHMPLIKRAGHWYVAASRDDLADESRFNEDKFSVLLTRPGLSLIGSAIHLARQPISDKPPSSTGRGLHYVAGGGIADVWQWRASHAGVVGHIDNSHFGAPVAPDSKSRDPAYQYPGGYTLDAAPTEYQSNVVELRDAAGRPWLRPRRLPLNLSAMATALGRIGEGYGESDGQDARWWMTESELSVYSAQLDSAIPDGTVLPSVLVQTQVQVTSTSIRGVAKWAAGRWTLELARRLYTGSPNDIAIKSGVLMWVAAFDHAEKRHTRHLRPFRLEVD